VSSLLATREGTSGGRIHANGQRPAAFHGVVSRPPGLIHVEDLKIAPALLPQLEAGKTQEADVLPSNELAT
jgi:hypothetical protein